MLLIIAESNGQPRSISIGMGILNDGCGWCPRIKFPAFMAVRIQMVVRSLELYGYILLLGIAEHEVQFTAVSASTENGFSRLERNPIHEDASKTSQLQIESPPPSGGTTDMREYTASEAAASSKETNSSSDPT
jgi:hypothetical protein